MDTFLSRKTKDVPDITNKGETGTQGRVELDEHGEQNNPNKKEGSIGNQEVENIMVRGMSLLELIKVKRNQDLW